MLLQSQVWPCDDSGEERMFGLDTRLELNVFELLMQCLIREGVSGRFA